MDARGEDALKKVRAFYPMMIVPGIVLLLAPATVETIMKYFGFRESLGGLLQVSYFAGGVLGIILITWFLQRVSVKSLLLCNVALLSVSLLAAAASPWYPLLLAFFLVAGFANGILITLPGVYVTHAGGASSHRAQNILYSFFSLGVVTGPILASLIIHNTTNLWRWAFVAPALLIIPLSMPVALTDLGRLDGVRPLSVSTVHEITGFNARIFYGLLAALILYIAAESAVSMWLVRFLENAHGVGFGAAHWVLTGLWAGITVGRWISGYLLKRIDPFTVLVFFAGAAGVFLLVAPLTRSAVAAVVIYPVVGLFYSAIYPCLIGYAGLFPQDLSSSVFTIFLAAGAAGGALLPYFIGLVNQYVGLTVGMCLISVPLFLVIACMYRIKSQVVHVNDFVPATDAGTELIDG